MASEDVPDVTPDPDQEIFINYDSKYDHELSDQKGPQLVNTLSKSSLPNISTTPRYFIENIHDLSRKKSESFLPIFIVLGCIFALGIICNILVCYIYRCRSRRATSNFFVIFYSIFDMFGCIIAIPLEVTALALPYTYEMVPLCKIMGFVITLCVCALCLTLICVVYDCYRKLCRTSEDFGVKKVRTLCLVLIVVAVVVSSPAFFVFDIKNVRTSVPGLVGKTCGISEDLPVWVIILYYVCMLSTIGLSLAIMTFLYIRIAANVRKRRQAEERGETASPAKPQFPKKTRFVREDTSTSSVTTNYTEEICRLHSLSNLSHSHHQSGDPARVPLKSAGSGTNGVTKSNSLQAGSGPPAATIVQLHVKHHRQALMFFVISVFFLFSMVPYTAVSILLVTTSAFDRFSSLATEIVFNLCIRSYLLNYVVKPVVYFIFNVRFREEVKHLFLKVWALCTRSSAEQHQQQASRQLQRSFTMGPRRSTSRTPIYRPPPAST